jgi:hypothetical protein
MKAYAMADRVIVQGGDTQIAIRYSKEPSAKSRYSSRELASADCVRFNQTPVHVGSHCCAFAVDPLPGGDYGIICACHPMLTERRSTQEQVAVGSV